MYFVLSLQHSVTCSPTSMQQQGSFHFQFHQSLAGTLTPIHGMITCTLHLTQNQKSLCTTEVSHYFNSEFLWLFLYCFDFFIWNIDFSAGKPKVLLTSDSPALNGSCISFTAKLEYPPCQKEDANGDLVWNEHCEDGMELEASGGCQSPVRPKS